MIALLRRDFRLLVLSPGGIGLLALWAFLVGAVFLMELGGFEQAEQRALALGDPAILALLDVNDLLLASVHNNLTIVLLFLAPLLAMRANADGAARDWLLQRASSTTSFVVARSLAMAGMVGVLLLLTTPLPVLLSIIGRPAVGDVGVVVDVGQAIVATALVALAGTTFVLLSSAIVVVVDNALAGALVAFLVLVILWVAPGGSALVGPALGELLSFVSPSSHLESGLRGLLKPADVLWFVVVDAAAVMATVTVLEGRRR